jgi:predicted membrane metal-binding protein
VTNEAGGDPIGRAVLRGIAVGDPGEVPPALDQRWRAVGIYHALSVSGLHLAVVAGLAFHLLRRLVAAESRIRSFPASGGGGRRLDRVFGVLVRRSRLGQ